MSGREEKLVRAYSAGVQAGNNATLNAIKVWLESLAQRFAEGGEQEAAELCQRLSKVPADALRVNEANLKKVTPDSAPMISFNNRPGILPDN